ncbi:DUF1045 domain-containing protein [Cucumibacter marinus]|uniref:DUF1045 domain-containing protein n=1 Tax=Cucumibacter marinus TaxID=1121252 RepID=UPI00040E0487|nr:DUF1045 domain-containing protein [Cucumibacter marinus]
MTEQPGTARFAIYFAPDPDSALWRAASGWLGRDAAGGEAGTIVPHGFDVDEFAAATASARRYGFHATLVAPMRLASGMAPRDLSAAAEEFAARHKPFTMGQAEIRNLAGFLAVMPVAQSDALTRFAGACVTHFRQFRAPMSAAEREKRLKGGLTARQTELLDEFGYPYVMEEFRFHMTLTDRLPETERTRYLEAATDRFADVLAHPLAIDRIAIFKEPEPGAPFRRIADFPLTGRA